jgi:hypothetical protein
MGSNRKTVLFGSGLGYGAPAITGLLLAVLTLGSTFVTARDWRDHIPSIALLADIRLRFSP